MDDSQWELQGNRGGGAFSAGMLRAALLFCSAGIALALILTPLLDNSDGSYLAQSYPEGVDRTTTGSIAPRGSYTIRRSVLQVSPDAVCVIRANGTRSGQC